MIRQLLKRALPPLHPLRLWWHHRKADIAAIVYGFPARHLTVIGVTGTDGKTTTVGMIAHALNACGVKTGALSTAFFQVGTDIAWNSTQKTSPSPFVVQRFLHQCMKSGCTHVVLECSSHGLLQGRMDYTFPSVAAITNISEEHLDYHGTMEDYIAAKALLFQKLKRPFTKKTGTAVLHYDDRSYQPILSSVWPCHTITYNATCKDIDDRLGPPINFWLENISVTHGGSKATVVWRSDSPSLQTRSTLELHIPGLFNLENALCAISCIKALPINPLPLDNIVTSLSSFRGVPGRMERVDEGQNFRAYIDFTVTPASYESTLSTLRATLPHGKKLIVVTGSCGDRMKEKRPIVGQICSRLADIVIVTNEDPYTEDPEQIIVEVLRGVMPTMQVVDTNDRHPPQRYAMKIIDRHQAIREALKRATRDDIVIFCGKGSDTTMMLASGQVPWNERKIVRTEIMKLASE